MKRPVLAVLAVFGLASCSAIDPNAAAEKAVVSGGDCVMCDLRYKGFDGRNLDNIDMRGAYLFNTNLERTSMISANLESAQMVLTDMERTDLTGASISSVVQFQTDYCGAKMPTGIAGECLKK